MFSTELRSLGQVLSPLWEYLGSILSSSPIPYFLLRSTLGGAWTLPLLQETLALAWGAMFSDIWGTNIWELFCLSPPHCFFQLSYIISITCFLDNVSKTRHEKRI